MDMNLIKLFENFNSEDRCRELLELLRWPSGVCCLRCGNVSVSKLEKRNQYECNGCRYQFSATDRKSTRLNSSHSQISYAVFCLKKKHNITPVQLARCAGLSPACQVRGHHPSAYARSPTRSAPPAHDRAQASRLPLPYPHSVPSP